MTALVGGLLKMFSLSSETDYEAALQKAEEPCMPYQMEIYDSTWEFSLEEKHRKEGEKKLGYTFGHHHAKEPLCKGRTLEGGGEDT